MSVIDKNMYSCADLETVINIAAVYAGYYLKTKQILGKNRAFLEEMIEQLKEKKTLSYKDIALIRDKYLPGVKQAG